MRNWLLIIASVVIIQLLVPFYELQLILFVLEGLALAFLIPMSKVFLRVLLVQGVLSVILYFLFNAENQFISDVLVKLGLSGIIAPLLYILVSAVTVASCYQIGQSVHVLVKK